MFSLDESTEVIPRSFPHFIHHTTLEAQPLAIFTFVVLHFHSTDFEMPVSLDNSGTLIPGGVSNR
jgi:hypothetical protein